MTERATEPLSRARTRRSHCVSRALSACLLLVLLPVPGYGQIGRTSPEQQNPAREERLSPSELLAMFEAPEEPVYRLGEGDELTIEVWGRPELSGRHVIGPDGQVGIPVVGNVRLAGLSREEAVKEITKSLQRYYTVPSVTLRVDRYTSNRVFVLGRVASPGELHFDVPPTLLEAIARAGSLPIGGIGAEKAALTRCAVLRGRDIMVWVDLKGLLKDGNLAMNLRLQRNDVVYIPDADDQLVYVMGEVQRPGAFHLTPEMSFLDALSQAGGLTENAASNRMHIIRPSQGERSRIELMSFLTPDPTLNFPLEEGDIIYAPRRTLARMGYIFEKLNPFTTFLLLGAALSK